MFSSNEMLPGSQEREGGANMAQRRHNTKYYNCLLKQMLAQHFSSLVLVFLYVLMDLA
jgi:hypothetical protein